MPTVDPRDPKLHRIHRVHEDRLEQARPLVHDPASLRPIHTLTLRLGRNVRVIVVDGTHRTQAALEEGITEIPAREVSWTEAAAEAYQEGLSLDRLVQFAVRFRDGEYSFSPY